MLKIENLHKIYGKYHALSGLNMTVKEGALYGFVGPNGAGKTTAIKIMTGLLEAEEGSVIINGEDALADPISCVPASAMYRISLVYTTI